MASLMNPNRFFSTSTVSLECAFVEKISLEPP